MKRPKCNKCGSCMNHLYIRKGNSRGNLGYYCKFCKVIYLNNGIHSTKEAVYIGLKQII